MIKHIRQMRLYELSDVVAIEEFGTGEGGGDLPSSADSAVFGCIATWSLTQLKATVCLQPRRFETREENRKTDQIEGTTADSNR